MKKIMSAISGFDIFTALPTLRMKGDPQVSNVCGLMIFIKQIGFTKGKQLSRVELKRVQIQKLFTKILQQLKFNLDNKKQPYLILSYFMFYSNLQYGGLFSICIFGFFTYVFITNVISTINLQRIQSKQSIQVNKTYQPIRNLKLAVGLQSMNLTQLRSFFQLRVFISQAGKPYVPVSIQPCTRQMWSVLDDSRYNTLNLQYHMCIKQDQIQIYGQNGAPNLKALYFNLSICSNLTSPVPCAPQAAIDYFFATYLFFGRYMACSFAILDIGFNPTNQNPITYTAYQKTLWLIFNRQQYIMSQTFIGTFKIRTDVSFLPVQSQTDQYGYFVVDNLVISVSNQNSSLLLVESFVMSTAINKVMERQYGKVDDVLSYVGGLFGIIISFLGFFLLSFNQYKYQLRVSQGAFSTENHHLSKESDFNFLKYLKYSLFDWIKTLCRCEPKWEDCIAIQEARQQANQQIDVKHLLQRISHIQMVIKTQNFDKQGDIAIYMVKNNAIQQAKRRRNILQYCNKFNDEFAGLTINTIENIDAVIAFSGLNKLQSPQIQFSSIGDFPKSTLQIQNLNQKSSFQIIGEQIEKYNQKLQQFFKNIQLQQQDKKAEQELMNSFYSLNEERRLKIVKNIPIGILYRLSKLNEEQNADLNNKNRKLIELNPLKNAHKFKRNNIISQNSLIQYRQQ